MHSYRTTSIQKVFTYTGLGGLAVLILAGFTISFFKSTGLILGLSLISTGVIGYTYSSYLGLPAGIKNNGVWYRSLTSRGIVAWVVGVVLTAFYVVLYFYPEYLEGIIRLFDPLSEGLSGKKASQWFVYGVLYTLAIVLFGIKFIKKYKHSKYQKYRTYSVIFFQTIFAFLIPEIMARLNGDLPYYDLKSIWPFNYYLFDSYQLYGFIQNGSLGTAL